jgi:4-alpha-glucanotransferase
VKRLLLAIHDLSFPSDPDEDVGRGSPATRAAGRLFRYARALGFTGIQLGPQGQTARDNASPYDGTIFARHTGTIGLRSGAFDGLVDAAALDAAVVRPAGGRARHHHAHDAMHALLERAYDAFAAGARPDLRDRLAAFHRAHAAWLEPAALHTALSARYRGISFRHWPELDRRYRPELATRPQYAEAIDRYAFAQLLAHEEHARVRAIARPLVLYGDLQVGYSDGDAWAYQDCFLRDYVMGAPPSRTNPEGQPWNYPVLDPAQYAGAAGRLVAARLAKAFAEYDSIRIDHPHGLVCPWVYHAGTADPAAAVRAGARLFESPDLPDHPALARFAIARPDQLDRSLPRHHDRWVLALDPEQIARYATLFDLLAGRPDVSCEVLSTMPYPLGCMLERHGLGRWRVTQKANLADASDVYRTENARLADWVMLGNHDTPPIFALIASWSPAQREAWARHLSARLALPAPERLASAGFLASAMLAELFVSRAENVSIFFADLFGYTERFNAPGTYNDDNWTLRLPPDFEALHRDRLARGAALDLALAVELAQRASETR